MLPRRRDSEGALPLPPPGGRGTLAAGWETLAAGWALGVALAAAFVGAEHAFFFDWLPRWLPPYRPLFFATAALTAFQLAASVAGRGRPAPGASLTPVLRLGLVLLLLGSTVWAWQLSWMLPLAAAFLLCEVVSWLEGPSAISLTLAAMLATALGRALWRLARGEEAAVSGLALAAMGAVVLVLFRRRLDRARLRRLGIRPWAPSELALVALALDEVIERGLRSAGIANTHYWMFYLDFPLALAVVAALVYLERRLRAAEAFAAAARPP